MSSVASPAVSAKPHAFAGVFSLLAGHMAELDRFLHGRTVFMGDAAHQVSPFGARGANSGIQDAENLAWKLASVIEGEADEALIGSYESERLQAAFLPHNQASRRVLEKNGFREEGYAENYLQIDGRWADHVLFALTRERWDARPRPGGP